MHVLVRLVLALAVLVPFVAVARSESMSASFAEGELAREEMKYPLAAAAFERAITEDPADFAAHVRFQDASLAAGVPIDTLVARYAGLIEEQPAFAEAMQLHALRLKPLAERLPALEAMLKAGESSNLLLEVGRARLASGDAPGAVKVLVKAVATAPASRTDVLLLTAEAELAAGAVDAARKRLENALRERPQFWLAHLALARADLKAGAHEAAETRARTVLEQRPSYVAAILVRSEARVGLNDLEGARAVLDGAARIAPEAREVMLARADLRAREGTEDGYVAAMAIYQSLIERSPQDTRAIYGKGWALEARKKWPEAEEAYRSILAIEPQHVDAINSVGYTLTKQGRVSEAQVQFKKVLSIDAQNVAAMLNLGSTYDIQGKWNDAIKLYEAVLKLRAHKNNLRALVNCAFDHEASGAYAKAAKLLEQAHDVSPNDANVLVWLGDNMYMQKKWKDAEKRYREALAIDDKLFFGWRGLAFVLIERKKIEDAIGALEKAYALRPTALELLVLMGDLHLEEGNAEAAYNKFKAYKDAGGTDPEVLQVLDELAAELGK